MELFVTVKFTPVKISTLGPIKTNSYYATKAYMRMRNIKGEVILCNTVEESFELLLVDKVQACVVCNLYPDIHKLYIPHLNKVTVKDVFINKALMGLYKHPDVKEIRTVATPITSTVFIKDDPFRIIIARSNAEAASMCKKGKVDAAIATKASANCYKLELIRDFGIFAVPYSVFKNCSNSRLLNVK